MDAPVLLFLHGGPGNSEMTRAHVTGPLWQRHFTVIHWDQRGAGRSYRQDLDRESMTLDQIKNDAIELARILRDRFPGLPLLLIGHSWGSLLGIHVVADRPDLFCAYVGTGQGVHGARNLEQSLRFVLRQARKKQDQEAVEALETMKPITPDQVGRLMEYVTRFGGAYAGRSGHDEDEALRAASPIARSPEELRHEDQGFSLPLLAFEVLTADLPKHFPQLELPVFFFEGVDDYVTPSALAEEYLRGLEAPVKKLVWFKKSAHTPHIEEPEAFSEALVEHVLPLCSGIGNYKIDN